ncbi:MAG: hypothetical protein VST72_07940, partial [Nitrospirota bacterium]|nr:hypothetical protein [Nitrospirota bacterium]
IQEELRILDSRSKDRGNDEEVDCGNERKAWRKAHSNNRQRRFYVLCSRFYVNRLKSNEQQSVTAWKQKTRKESNTCGFYNSCL